MKGFKALKTDIGFCNIGHYNSGNYNIGNQNTGNRNTGDRNTGSCNNGSKNSGCYNSGDYNSGDRNSGRYNSGNWNTGDHNAGECNSGDYNSGYRNSGDYNSGDRNSGRYNSGNCNSGHWNSGNGNNGMFNTSKNPTIRMFDEESSWTIEDCIRSKAYKILRGCPYTYSDFVCAGQMTDEEKKEHPEYETIGGYVKVIVATKDNKQKWWDNLSEEDKQECYKLPNFDADKFVECLGIEHI